MSVGRDQLSWASNSELTGQESTPSAIVDLAFEAGRPL